MTNYFVSLRVALRALCGKILKFHHKGPEGIHEGNHKVKVTTKKTPVSLPGQQNRREFYELIGNYSAATSFNGSTLTNDLALVFFLKVTVPSINAKSV